MPTYAYACTSCGHRFELYQSFSDAALTECPECAGTLRKEYGSVGVVFKGSGFYRTDSRSSSSSSDSSSSSSSSSGSSSSGSSTSGSSTSGSSGSGSSSSSSPSSTTGSSGKAASGS
ncbi:MAG TPA: FmdB family zinc ribbon protein [Actinotalea caeni]|nr:FmdB family zinc ribbon protein [Actinotalea caeni]HLV55006.1 FmdB family zinc ribbon protein [Actinotalea caeni]